MPSYARTMQLIDPKHRFCVENLVERNLAGGSTKFSVRLSIGFLMTVSSERLYGHLPIITFS